MAKIALLDDRRDHRNTILRSMQNALDISFHDWTCCECPILKTPEAYLGWILKEDIQVLLVDQLLNERIEQIGHPPVQYKGHDVISAIRKRMPDFPIFVVTALITDEDLQDHLGDAEEIFKRSDFAENVRTYLARMTRSGQRFSQANANRLARLSVLAKKAAAGLARKAEIVELCSLQQGMALAVSTEDVFERDAAIGNLEVEVKRLESLCHRIGKKLGRKKQ